MKLGALSPEMVQATILACRETTLSPSMHTGICNWSLANENCKRRLNKSPRNLLVERRKSCFCGRFAASGTPRDNWAWQLDSFFFSFCNFCESETIDGF